MHKAYDISKSSQYYKVFCTSIKYKNRNTQGLIKKSMIFELN